MAPLLVKIFMNTLENDTSVPINPFIGSIYYWYHYVEGVLCVWTDTGGFSYHLVTFFISLSASQEEVNSINLLTRTNSILTSILIALFMKNLFYVNSTVPPLIFVAILRKYESIYLSWIAFPSKSFACSGHSISSLLTVLSVCSRLVFLSLRTSYPRMGTVKTRVTNLVQAEKALKT